jgi:lambda family phage tail tape measure protein
MATKNREVGIRLSVKDAEVAKRALEAFGKDGQAALKRIENSAKPASVSLHALNAATSGVKGALMGFASTVLPMLTLAGAIHQARAAMERFGQINDQARATGLDVEYFQGLAYAAKLEGVEVDALSGSLETYAKNSGLAAEGKGKMVSNLKVLNPELLRNIQLATTQEQRVRLAADAINAAVTASDKAALATTLFGDQGTKLVAVFDAGAAAIDQTIEKARQLGIVVDRETIEKADELGDRFDTAAMIVDLRLKQAFINLGPMIVWSVERAADLAKYLSDAAEDLAALSRGDFSGAFETAGDRYRRLRSEILNEQTAQVTDQGLGIEYGAGGIHEAFMGLGVGRTNDVGAGARYGDIEDLFKVSGRSAPPPMPGSTDIPSLPTSDEAKAAIKEAEALIKRLRTASEEYAATMADLAKKQADGLITQETYNRAAGEAALKFAQAADSSSEYADALARLDDAKAKGIITEKQYTDAVESLTKRRLIAQNDWVAGVQLGLQQIQSGAREVTSDVAQAIGGWAESLGEQIGAVFRTGKLNWQDLVKTMLADIAKLATQQFITRPLAGLLGNIFGGMFGGGGLTPQPVTNIGFGSYGSFDTGGWTGDGNPSDPAGMVHRREFVVKAGPASRYRQALEAMNSGQSFGFGGGSFTLAPTYNVDGSGLSPGQLLAVLDQHSSMLLDRVSSIVKRDVKNGVFEK